MADAKLDVSELNFLRAISQAGAIQVSPDDSSRAAAQRLKTAGLIRALPLPDRGAEVVVLSGAGIHACREAVRA